MMENFSVLDRIIVNMKILSQIQVGDKLQIDYQQNFYIDKYYFQSIYRTAFRQSRTITCTALLKLVSDLQSISPGCFHPPNGITTDLLKTCKAGIINLQETYIDDHECCGCLCRITEQLQHIIDEGDACAAGCDKSKRLHMPPILDQPANRSGAEGKSQRKRNMPSSASPPT